MGMYDCIRLFLYLMDTAQLQVGKNTALMTKEDKMKYIKFLDDHGAFLITYANARVCEALDISQFTLYNYLRILRNDKEEKKEEKGGEEL